MGSDIRGPVGTQRGDISIHAPRMGSDPAHPARHHLMRDFNPRSPDGERPEALAKLTNRQDISIHAPRMGSDAKMDIFAHDMGKIIHFQH